MPMTADRLRSAFLDYFTARAHERRSSAGLIPAHAAAPLFVNAGMVPFLPYFLGEERPGFSRVTTAQKCVRVRGKHDDIDVIGISRRHLTFFEMLGNFSFGDYFKRTAIEYGWDFLTEVLGIDPDRLWVTVHESDGEAAELWREVAGVPFARIQRLTGDNFWEMGPTGPCGPSSEIFYDMGAELGPDGGPAHGGEDRFVEIWNLVFMTYNRLDDGSLRPLPQVNIDTGAGLERILPILRGGSSVFETDVLRRLISAAEEACGRPYGMDEGRDVSLRIVADHARSMTFLLADGVVPSNGERGYVLRRIIRRAALHARRAGARSGVLPRMAGAVAQVMGQGYPELAGTIDRVKETLEREEHRFHETLTQGLGLLDGLAGREEISGEVAFLLHDTHGFPIELTREVAAERGLTLDEDGFAAAMERQRAGARVVKAATTSGTGREVLDESGTTEFLGYEVTEADTTLLRVTVIERGRAELYADATPFYPEGGGQIGDTGQVRGPTGRGRVLDTDAPVPGVIRHLVEVAEGTFEPGQRVRLEVDRDRRAALRRSHTGTHLLHWALNEVVGGHVRQQGSLVAPDYLRFDFNHHAPLTDDQIHEVEALIAAEVLGNQTVEVTRVGYEEAKRAGAISFFGEKYGDVVRVVKAGEHSMELCGGTHVSRLGDIGQVLITAESSIGANLRRVEARVGLAAFEEASGQRALLRTAARLLKSEPGEVPDGIERLRESARGAERERRRLAAELDRELATAMARGAEGGVVVRRCDGRDQAALRHLAGEVLAAGVRAVGLVGSPDGRTVALSVDLAEGGSGAPEIARRAAGAVGGGAGGKDPRRAVAGGRDVSGVERALAILREELA
ncbi:alanine--tRNA ligase [Nonomuraea sp. NPDC050540]|uniref:alanine--tRNA ligase n=1 Tax=Nonomuraea sp. NPDC050540 TaxID=3364367 RepID=UPI003794CD7F